MLNIPKLKIRIVKNNITFSLFLLINKMYYIIVINVDYVQILSHNQEKIHNKLYFYCN